MKRRVEAYKGKKNDKIFIHSWSMTVTGMWVATKPFLVIDAGEQNYVKGNYLFDAMKSSQKEVPHPDISDNAFKPVLDLAGVKSWSEFAKYSKSCSIELENNKITYIPYRNLGSRKGYGPIDEKKIIVSSDATPEELGNVLDRAFESCE